MRLEYISPIVEAAVEVLSEILPDTIQQGEFELRESPAAMGQVAAMVGLAGQVEGRFLLDMSIECALYIASVMNEEPFSELTPLGRATISELSNMVASRAVTKLSDLGFSFDVTPPSVITGEKLTVTNMELETLAVPIDFSGHNISVNVAIRERN